MYNNTVTWLLDTGNPAIRHRTKTELLNLKDSPEEAFTWITQNLPTDWHRTKGLWYVYYINALAECGLEHSIMPPNWFETAFERIRTSFDFSCESFMLLQALITLGFHENPHVQKILSQLYNNHLPDGGFLCEKRRIKLNYIPKSCYKADYYALRLCSCCRKRGIILNIEQDLIHYFLDRNLLFQHENPNKLVLDGREGWRNSDIFSPFEPMRIGIQNIMETISSLGYGNAPETAAGWNYLNAAKDDMGRVILSGTLTKSYLPKEKIGKPSAWATFYSLLADKEREI